MPGPSFVRSSIASVPSRLSTQATSSSPSAFQSIAVEKQKNVQPSVSFAKRATSCHCAGGTRAITGRVPGSPVTPGICASCSRAWSLVTSVDLRRGFPPFAGGSEVRDLILQQEQPVQQRFRARRAPGHVDVYRNDAIDPFDNVIAMTERTAGVG